MEDPNYYEEPNAPHGDFTPNYDQFGKGNKSGDLSDAHIQPLENGKKEATVKVEHGYVINLPLCNLLSRKVTELKECYIVLYEHFIVYKVIGKLEVYDDISESWKEEKINFRWTRVRSDIHDVTMQYDNKEDLYSVEIEIGRNTQTWFWPKGADAKKFYDIMQNYFVTRDQKIEEESINK